MRGAVLTRVELIDRGLYSPSERNDQTFALLGNQAKDDQMKVISKDGKRSRKLDVSMETGSICSNDSELYLSAFFMASKPRAKV